MQYTHLVKLIGTRVRVDLDNPDRHEYGTLIKIGRSPRVRFDDGRERNVAAWRVMSTDKEDAHEIA